MKYEIDNKIININEIISMNIDEDEDLRIITKKDVFYADKNYKKQIEILLNKKDLYISKDLTIYINEIISMNFGEYDLIINTDNNFIYTDKKHKNKIEKILNKKKLYTTEDFTVYINEIKKVRIDEDDYLNIIVKNDYIFFTDKKHYKYLKPVKIISL